MTRRLLLDETFKEFIRHLSPNLKRKICAALDDILKNSEQGKPLVEDLQGLWSYKIGNFRIVYRPAPTFIEILGIGPRENIYEKIALELKRLRS